MVQTNWPNFLCACPVFSSGSVQLHWSQWPLCKMMHPPNGIPQAKDCLEQGTVVYLAADVTGFAPLASYLFSWQEYLASGRKHGVKQSDQEFSDMVSPEASAQSASTTTCLTLPEVDQLLLPLLKLPSYIFCSGQYMSTYDPDEEASITGWHAITKKLGELSKSGVTTTTTGGGDSAAAVEKVGVG
ncbi:hypothetical protein H6P81_019146 [Aristolochia fimbriata]|uniref:Uncharacterized protein n=1 Tax=Aristolochia fimbriata TaxID=158543 RepID=A0AAV7DS10_ARIFI|nr:hypothetical protein H6P81_019146 [Aristolochia fimbriata]